MSKDSDAKRDQVLRRLLKTPPKPRVVHRGKSTSDKIKEALDEADRTGDPAGLAEALGQKGPTKKG